MKKYKDIAESAERRAHAFIRAQKNLRDLRDQSIRKNRDKRFARY